VPNCCYESVSKYIYGRGCDRTPLGELTALPQTSKLHWGEEKGKEWEGREGEDRKRGRGRHGRGWEGRTREGKGGGEGMGQVYALAVTVG